MVVARGIGQRLLCPTLVGRDDEQAALSQALATAARGRGQAILVGGDAGVGKTALVRQFVENARATAARVLLGECIEIDARRPLGPFIDAIEQARRASYIRPEDALRLSPLLTEAIDETAKPRLLDGFARVFAGIARSAQLVLVIEDLHWADEASHELLTYLVRRMRSEPVVLVGTYRTDELHRRHPLRPVIAELVAARAIRELVLQPLRTQAVSRFIRETLRMDRDPASAFRDAIDARCEGNPFFMEEVLETLRSKGALTLRDGRWSPTTEAAFALPDSIRDAVDRRAATLDDEVRRVLRIAAVIGQRFDFDLLAGVSQTPVDRLAELLRPAIALQLLVESEGGGFAFRHALTRESVLTELLEPERRVFHLAIARALERRADAEQHAEELAYHFDAAGDREKAFHAHLAAAERARPLAAGLQVIEHIRRAIEIAPVGTDVLPLYMRLAEAEANVDQARGARAYRDVFERANAAGRMLEAGAALTALTISAIAAGQPDAGDVAKRAVEILEPLGETREFGRAVGALARWYAHTGERELAKQTAMRAVEIARAFGDRRFEINSMVTANTLTGDPASAAHVLREAIDEGRKLEYVGVAFRCYDQLFWIFTYAMWPGRDELIDEWIRYAEEVGYVNFQQHRIALHWVRNGDFDAALRCLAEATWSAGEIGYIARVDEAMIRVARDGPTAGADILGAARTAPLDAHSKGLLINDVSQVLLLQGDVTQILAIADEWEPAHGRHLITALYAARAVRDPDAIGRYEVLAGSRGVAGWRFGATYLDAERKVAEGDSAKGAELIGAVANAMEMLDSPAIGTALRLRQVELLVEADRTAALAILARVVGYWRKAKATWYLGELARWARERHLELPADPEAREGSHPSKALTERELDVARLVALGLTNKDIADRLVISERTAEGHVQRILDKLGFRSRSQIAAWHASGRHEAAASR